MGVDVYPATRGSLSLPGNGLHTLTGAEPGRYIVHRAGALECGGASAAGESCEAARGRGSSEPATLRSQHAHANLDRASAPHVRLRNTWGSVNGPL